MVNYPEFKLRSVRVGITISFVAFCLLVSAGNAQSYYSGSSILKRPNGSHSIRAENSTLPTGNRQIENLNIKKSSRKQTCQEQVWGFTPIQDLEIKIAPTSEGQAPVPKDQIPNNLAAKRLATQPRIQYTSDSHEYIIEQQGLPASKFAHHPLYFEEINLERHGKRTRFLQPVWSGVRFYSTIPMLSYKMAQEAPSTHAVSRDPYPAGLPAPWVRERNRVSAKGVSGQLLAVAATILLLP